MLTFHFLHRWSTKNNILTGVTLLPWLQILLAHGASIEWRTYAFRVVFLTFMACLNSLLAIVETVNHSGKLLC